MGGFSPGDIYVYSMMVGGSGGSVDIRAKVAEFSVFENIKKPYHTVQLNVEDDGDILNYNLGLNGTNMLALSFGQPGQDPYTNQFVLTQVEKNVSIENQRTAKYTITGYSPHMTKFPKVQKAYKNMTGTDIAQDLIDTYLSPIKSLIVSDPSSGMLGNDKMPYNINGIQIHKAITAALSRSKSNKYISSAYTFFEDAKNMRIDTLENLLNTALGSPVETYYQKPMGKQWLVDQRDNNFVILNFREDARVDASKTAQVVNTKTQSFDTFSEIMTGLNLGGGGGGGGGATTYWNIPYNIMRPPTFLAQILPERAKIAARLDSQAVTCVVTTNPALTVGAGVNIQTLAPPGTTDQVITDAISGPLLITETRHTVRLLGRPKVMGTTTFKGVRGSAEG